MNSFFTIFGDIEEEEKKEKRKCKKNRDRFVKISQNDSSSMLRRFCYSFATSPSPSDLPTDGPTLFGCFINDFMDELI